MRCSSAIFLIHRSDLIDITLLDSPGSEDPGLPRGLELDSPEDPGLLRGLQRDSPEDPADTTGYPSGSASPAQEREEEGQDGADQDGRRQRKVERHVSFPEGEVAGKTPEWNPRHH